MKVPVEWISEYLAIDGSVDELADHLTMAGLEVEEINEISAEEIQKSGGAADNKDPRVFVTKVTPNRGDWLSMIGVAREAAAVTGWAFSLPQPAIAEDAADVRSHIDIKIEAPDLCRRYVGVVARNVKIKESPEWMKNRLIRAGMRPINNIVDITNYVMLELGQPLHAFDYDLIRGKQIIVRRAKDGETITSIDEVERVLNPDILVIADKDRALAIAGVMGGADSEVTGNTTNILLESANFDAVSVRRTSKKLPLSTESSYRFERGVDPGVTALAAMRAAELMRDLADAEIVPGIIDEFPGKVDPTVIEVRPQRVNSVLGVELTSEDMVRNLNLLHITAELHDIIRVVVPTFRSDINREIDVIEEIARVHGYQDMPETLPPTPAGGMDSAQGDFVEKMRHILMACGLQEVLTHSFVGHVPVEVSGMTEDAVPVRNPLSEDTAKLRVMLTPNLLDVVARNQSVGIKDLGIFEVGKVYRRKSPVEVNEFRSVAAVMVGSQWNSSWNLSKDALNADFYLAKGALESLLMRFDISGAEFAPAEHPMLHTTRTAAVSVKGIQIGILGEVAPDVCKRLGLRGRPVAFELEVDRLMEATPKEVTYVEMPKYPALYRHLAVVVGRDVSYTDICQAVSESGGNIVEDVNLMDVYTGANLSEVEHSLTLSIVFRSRERTLTDDEVNGVLESVKGKLSEVFGAKLRA